MKILCRWRVAKAWRPKQENREETKDKKRKQKQKISAKRE